MHIVKGYKDQDNIQLYNVNTSVKIARITLCGVVAPTRLFQTLEIIYVWAQISNGYEDCPQSSFAPSMQDRLWKVIPNRGISTFWGIEPAWREFAEPLNPNYGYPMDITNHQEIAQDRDTFLHEAC